MTNSILKKYSIITFIVLTYIGSITQLSSAQLKKTIKNSGERLCLAYPDFIIKVENNIIYWKDGTTSIFNDEKVRTLDELDENPDIEDMFKYNYDIGIIDTPKFNYDPGRIRNKDFFKKMYGKNSFAVQQKLVDIQWLPHFANKSIKMTSVNDVDKKIKAISDELEKLPYLKEYIDNPGGAFNWRNISGTDNLSPHAFGICIDINVKQSNYWRWDYKSDIDILKYKNKIPYDIVKIFEKYGFIWGGRWYHCDTMHSDYRPELLHK